ncbi:MAG: glutamate-1-semialdehyde 2,1-aminomutase [Tannerella sp.]|jgi:glutamate-1-semialdehyde 2,1-aminomutase|nr:glutamate-1-semialdehyde 2,1-aminomutase [Tannerella sp.]
MQRIHSVKAGEEARQYLPGGVNSPVRALRSVETPPLFVRKALGATLTDVDGNRFTDFCLSWGVFILGHGHPSVNNAVRRALRNGTSYGIPSLPETALARAVNRYVPSMEKVRFVSSGTEAVMSAIRLARGFTGRDLIVKFDGCYHGHADHLLLSAGSGVSALAASSSAGVPDAFTASTVSVPFNDIDTLKRLFRAKGAAIAAVILEPVPANMGVVLPREGFLPYLRDLTARHGSLLIFDEVITGFRLTMGGVQGYTGLRPDLTTLGKILGGGFPAAAFGGRAEVMDLLAPDGPVYQAGTLSGNPVAMSAGAATLETLGQHSCREQLEMTAGEFYRGLSAAIRGKDITLACAGSMFTLFFMPRQPASFDEVKQADTRRFGAFFRYMFEKGFYLSPSQFEANFLSIAHSAGELERFIRAVEQFDAS